MSWYISSNNLIISKGSRKNNYGRAIKVGPLPQNPLINYIIISQEWPKLLSECWNFKTIQIPFRVFKHSRFFEKTFKCLQCKSVKYQAEIANHGYLSINLDERRGKKKKKNEKKTKNITNLRKQIILKIYTKFNTFRLKFSDNKKQFSSKY